MVGTYRPAAMPRDMPSTTREFAQLEEAMAHERKMSVGPARLSNHASALREDQINREAKLVASAETAKIMARVSSSSKDFAEEKTNEDDFVWPVLGTKLPHHKRQHVKHWRDTHGEPEPML